jgi:hypothetical protein
VQKAVHFVQRAEDGSGVLRTRDNLPLEATPGYRGRTTQQESD